MDCSMPGCPVLHYLSICQKLMAIKSVMPSNHLILCPSHLLLHSIFPSIRVFFNKSLLNRWPKYWSFSFGSVLSMNIQGWFPFSSVQSLSCVRLFVTPWTAAHQASLSITNSGVCSDSSPLSWWCHITIASSVVPFSSCLQTFPASGSSPRSKFFA